MTLGKNGLTLADDGISLALSADWSYYSFYGAPMNSSANGLETLRSLHEYVHIDSALGFILALSLPAELP